MTDIRAYEAYFNGEGDARRLNTTILLCYGLLYAHFAVACLGWLPLWTFCLSAPILVVRWMLATHELLHLRTEREVDWVTRLMPLMLTPLTLGYREYVENHRGHHRHMATPADPEYYQLRGGTLRGLCSAMAGPELSFVLWVMRAGVDRELWVGTALRAGLFVLLVYLAGGAFWWYWIPVRLAFGASFFAFFYSLHRHGAEYGVYRAAFPGWFAALFTVLFGREALLATTFHDVHHAYPRVSAYWLPTVARDLPGAGLPVK